MSVINICKYNKPNKRIEIFQMNKKKNLNNENTTKQKKIKFGILN